jgi:DNA-binding transcriptional LysR family regulator
MLLVSDVKWLRQLVVLAETLNVTKAAEQLHIAQPALSLSLRRLEDRLGVRLFEREARGVRLTAAGAAAVHEAKLALSHLERLETSAKDAAYGTSGRLRVSFVASAAHGFLQRVVPDFVARYPNIQLVLSEASSFSVARAIREETADVGIVRTPLIEELDAEFLEVEADVLVAALPLGHFANEIPKLELRDLSAERFVMYRQFEAAGLRSATMLACQEAGFMPKIGQEATQIATLLSLVESGLGIGLVPSVAQKLVGDRVHLRPFSTIPAAARLGLSLAFVHNPPPVVSRFAASVRDTLGL